MSNRQLVRLTKPIVLCFFTSLTGCNPASGPVDAVFEYVDATSKWDNAGQISRKFVTPRAVPRYLIVDGKVYLLTQVTQPHLLNVAVLEQPEWRKIEFTSLIQKHPELKGYNISPRWAGAR